MKYPLVVERDCVSLYLTRWIDDGGYKPPYKPDNVVYVVKYTAMPVKATLPFKIMMTAKYTHKQLCIAGYHLRLEDDDKYFKHMAETMEIPTDETYEDVEEQEGEPYWRRYEPAPKKERTYTTTYNYGSSPIRYTATTDSTTWTGTAWAHGPARDRVVIEEQAQLANQIENVTTNDEFTAIPINNVNTWMQWSEEAVEHRFLNETDLERVYTILDGANTGRVRRR